MCTVDEEIRIGKEVKAWMLKNKMFTSVDIGNAMKDKGDTIRNRDVAHYLRTAWRTLAIWAGASYEQTPIDVTLADGVTTQASLYHPQGADISEYTDRSQVATPPVRGQSMSQNFTQAYAGTATGRTQSARPNLANTPSNSLNDIIKKVFNLPPIEIEEEDPGTGDTQGEADSGEANEITITARIDLSKFRVPFKQPA